MTPFKTWTLGALLLTLPCLAAPTPEIDHLDQNTLILGPLPNGQQPKPIKTGLFDLAYHGVIGKGPSAHHVLVGKVCENCPREKNVFLLRPLNGNGEFKLTPFVLPGKVVDPKTGALVLDARAFVGRCLPKKFQVSNEEAYVVFQKERVDRKHSPQSSVFVAEPSDQLTPHLEERLIERRLPRLEDTLKLVRAKLCREIPGSSRVIPKKPIDLDTPQSKGLVDDASDDDDDDEAGAAQKPDPLKP